MPDPAALFASLIFGVIGFAAFRYGRKNGLLPPLALGIALMVYPYFISRTWALYAIGCGLCLGLYVLRE